MNCLDKSHLWVWKCNTALTDSPVLPEKGHIDRRDVCNVGMQTYADIDTLQIHSGNFRPNLYFQFGILITVIVFAFIMYSALFNCIKISNFVL